MPRDGDTLAPGDWVEEVQPPRRKLRVLAVHRKPGQPAPNVEMAVEGNPVNRLTLSIYAVTDSSRFKRIA